MDLKNYQIIVIGGGHAGAEAAWAAANLLPASQYGPGAVALVTIDPAKIGVMSCNPAIGGLAKGQLVREIDAMGGLMGLAADATGIMFKMLNTSRGPAVRGPRCQNDKHAYAEAVQSLVGSRDEIEVVCGTVEKLVVEHGRIRGVEVCDGTRQIRLESEAVILTTGTFMRGLMHVGQEQTPGGRQGEAPAMGISAALIELGFELGRLKTGTPPRLKRGSIDWDGLDKQWGDDDALAFSELTAGGWSAGDLELDQFPLLEQVSCRVTSTNAQMHDLIRLNLHRAPMYSGQIHAAGPRYCPAIEDKVVRFGKRESHTVFLEPESLRDDWVYCNGISTSLPADVQEQLVRMMPGCERAEIHQFGYAVEYDMVRSHQIHATGMTKSVEGLFLAGQINGTSGYEEAAAQGLVAGVNAVRFVRGESEFLLGRDEAYIGVLMDDLVTKTPVEPYRMFTSRAEHRLILRADNAPDRLTPIADRLGMLDSTELGRRRKELFAQRQTQIKTINSKIDSVRIEGEDLARVLRRPGFDVEHLQNAIGGNGVEASVWATVHADRKYDAYILRQHAAIRRQVEMEHRRLPNDLDYDRLEGLRAEARHALERFRPATFGQAGRLEGVTPADLTLLAVLVKRFTGGRRVHADNPTI